MIRKNGISNCIDTGIGRFPDNHGSRTGVVEFENSNFRMQRHFSVIKLL